MAFLNASLTQHLTENTAIPRTIECNPPDGVDFHFTCKIPSNLQDQTDDLTTHLRKFINDYIEQVLSGSSRLGANAKSYFCTFCNNTFESASSWKRHEQDFHEPQRQWRCPDIGCSTTFWQKNKFERHHEKRHGCLKCPHAAAAVTDVLPKKTGWGCGFCPTFCDMWKARCNHVAAHFEALPRVSKKHWSQKTIIEGLLLQPGLVEVRESLLNEPAFAMPMGSCNDKSMTPRAVEELLRDLSYLDTQRDHRVLVQEALMYIGLYSGNTTRASSPPPPSTTYFESIDEGYGYSLPSSDDFGDSAGSDEKGFNFDLLAPGQLFDDPNEDFGLGQYGFYMAHDDGLR